MTTEIHRQPGIPPSDYPRHVERVLNPTTPKFGRLFKLASYRRSVGLDTGGRYDWVLFVLSLLACLAAFAWLYFCFYE
jgi:hypothetical protein